MLATLYVVATPIGNLDDFSPRAIQTLKSCRYILAEDTRHSATLLAAFDIQTPLRSYYQFNEKFRSEQVIEDMLSNAGGVALITDAGTPCISDPGYLLVRAAHAAGISVIGVSGPSAVVTALSVSGLPAERFSFFGFPPRTQKQLTDFLTSLHEAHARKGIRTHIMYESPKRIVPLVRKISSLFPQAFISVSTELTKKHEKTMVGPATEVLSDLESDPYAAKGEYTVVLHFPDDSTPEDDRGETDESNLSGESLSVEALIVDAIVKKNVSVKEAVTHVAKERGIARNKAYTAGLNVRRLLDTSR